MSVATCPSCGAPIEFAIGSSVVVICGYCRSVVARTDVGVESYGKVAALIDTGSPLAVGVGGSYRGRAFRITGRSQLRHEAGGVWDEWYAAFDDGSWGWLAEAQGKQYMTFRSDEPAPPHDELALGQRWFPDHLMVSEIGKATLISAEGELPWKPRPGDTYAYADLTGGDKRFGTIDYSEEPPLVFLGHETSLKALGISGEAVRQARVGVAQLNCSKCGGRLDLRAPDQTERIWCPNCGAGHDVSAGKLAYFKTLKTDRKTFPLIPLGSTGTIGDVKYVLAGFMERSVTFDETYYWTEYLLYNQDQGFRWLVNSDDHWSFVEPLTPGEVQDPDPTGVAKAIHWSGRRYRLFQDATAKVTYVVGEFYWKVAAGETVDTVDYVAPPFGISKEITRAKAREITYSHARYLQVREVEQAFGLPPDKFRRPYLVGPMQPYTGARLGKLWAFMLLALLGVAIFLGITLPGRTVVDKTFELVPPAWTDAEPPPAGVPKTAAIVFSEPFELSGKHNVLVRAESVDVYNSWLYIAGDLVEEKTDRLESFELPLEYYAGVEDGENWSEGSRKKRAYLAAPPAGRYLLRLETQWPETVTSPPRVRVVVREGVFRWSHFLAALILLSILPVLAMIRHASFEAQRWKDSAHSPFGQWETSSEEDDDE